MLSEKTIKKLNEIPEFTEYKEYVISVIEEINTTNGLIDLDNQKAGELAKVRHLTIEAIYKMLDPIITPPVNKKPKDEMLKQAKDKFGL